MHDIDSEQNVDSRINFFVEKLST